MRFLPWSCDEEVHEGPGPGGTLLRGDLLREREPLLLRNSGQVQTVYLDPPFNSGKAYILRQRCGEAGWQKGTPFLDLPAYSDQWPEEEAYYALLREAAEIARELLREDGSLFLHIDSRTHARLRLMLDEVFGAGNFVNEIVWSYHTGGRSRKHFSRKHDIILFYRKSRAHYFNIEAVGVPRAGARRNHMRRSVDEDGRSYRSIVTLGKEYRYYDDEPAFPGDVWDDIAHMQQMDPQRTGYDNQKPVKLLERVILCASRPGDLVCDLFAGSGTTAVAAAEHGRRFFMLDSAAAAAAVCRKRLLGRKLRVAGSCDMGAPKLRGSVLHGVGLTQITLSSYELEAGLCPLALPDAQAVDQISAGYLRGQAFHPCVSAARTKATPRLPKTLEIPVLQGRPALLTVDVLGRRMVHVIEESGNGEQV